MLKSAAKLGMTPKQHRSLTIELYGGALGLLVFGGLAMGADIGIHDLPTRLAPWLQTILVFGSAALVITMIVVAYWIMFAKLGPDLKEWADEAREREKPHYRGLRQRR